MKQWSGVIMTPKVEGKLTKFFIDKRVGEGEAGVIDGQWIDVYEVPAWAWKRRIRRLITI
jgi:hypothetical protein